MKVLPLLLAAAPFACAAGGVIDLVNPARYADQPVPDYINRDNTPADNPITDHGATLGRVLFYDKRLSRNDTISCASCHQQERAFSDLAVASTGVAGTTGRHSMRLVNARFSAEEHFFWDERAPTLEAQTTQPIQDHVEMGFSGADGDPGFSDLVDKLEVIELYQVLFKAVYGDPAITEARIQNAIAQFVRSIQSFDSRYDEGRAAVGADGPPFPNFTASENNGKQLFLAGPGPGGGAGCAACHQPPAFDIAPNSGNNGVVGAIGGGNDFTVTRSPSLRDLVGPGGTSNGGFMHTGEFATLEQVIAHYNAIPAVVTGLDPRLTRPGGPGGPQAQRLNLSGQQQADLAAFLRTLTGSAIYTDPKWSDPFDEDGQLALVVLPTDGMTMTFSGAGEARQLTVGMSAVAHVDYVFQWSGDLEQWGSLAVTADAQGSIEVVVPAPECQGQGFFRLAYAPAAE
ncbi:cytochrome-c peroxidase [Haloferula sp. A504]|uniref:cytochrome-c peroxidase n=1 Tax=Haloferula sp. A504 TaxID=3373601 RepID=UPI0031C0D92E|nr:cytochrome-c peroxidase [Verrucomicrobiaceae bacterium E54]